MISLPGGKIPPKGESVRWARCIAFQPVSDGNVFAVLRVEKILRSQHVKDPSATVRKEWSVDGQLVRLNFQPLPKLSQFGTL